MPAPTTLPDVRWGLRAVALMALLLAPSLHAATAPVVADHSPTLEVGVYEGGWPPFDIVHAGTVGGLSWDYAQRVFGSQGYVLHARIYPDWPALLKAACADQVDIVLDVTPSTAKDACFTYSDSYLEALPVIVARRDGRIHDAGDLADARIATARDFSISEGLPSFFPSARIEAFDSPLEAVRAVSDGRADAYIANPWSVRALLATLPGEALHVPGPTQLPFDTMRFGLTRRAGALLPAVNDALRNISSEDHALLRERWLGPLGGSGYSVPLTAADKEAVARAGTVRVGYDPHAAPLSFTDDYGQASGLSPAFLREVAAAVGMRLQFVATASLEDTLALAREGKLDIVLGASRDTVQLPGFAFTLPITPVPLVAVMKRGSPATSTLASLAGRRIGLGAGVSEARQVIEQLSGTRTLPQGSAADGLAKVANGGLDVYIDNFTILDPYLNRQYVGELKVAAQPAVELGASFALAPRVAALRPIIDRALEAMPASEQSLLRNTWVQRSYRTQPSFGELLDRFGAVLIGLVVVVVTLGTAYLRLRAEVNRRRSAEERAAASGNALAIVAGNLPGVVFKLWRHPDGTLHFPLILGRAEPLFGLSADEMMADEPKAFGSVWQEDQPRLLAALDASAESMAPFIVEFRTSPHGALRWVRSSGTPRSRGDDGVSWSGFWVDVTDKYEQAAALESARRDAEAAADAKGRFLATMSHELRTPMHGIIGMLELVRGMPLGANQSRILDVVAESSDALAAILDDVLDFSQLGEERMHLDTAPTDLRDVVEGAVAGLMPRAVAKGLIVDIDIAGDLSPSLLMDGARVRQIVVNLVGNAVKFTDKGFVGIGIAAGSIVDRVQNIAITVSDSGIGIALEDQHDLFDAFAQAHGGIHRRFGGSGLGLSICRNLATLMAGTLTLESQQGEGTTVTFTAAFATNPAERATPPLSGIVFDIAESLPSWASRAVALLLSLGAEVRSDGKHAMFKVSAGDASSGALPLLRVTEHYEAGGYRVDSGGATLCVHPLTVRAAIAAVSSLKQGAGNEPGRLVPLSSRAEDEHLAADVLVVEDHPANRELAIMQLASLGLSSHAVASGEEALTQLATQRYAVVITDLFLGGMDGMAWTAAWRDAEQQAGRPRTPVLLVTASVTASAASGDGPIDAVLGKPLRRPALREALMPWFTAASTAPLNLAAAVDDFGSEAIARKVLAATVRTCEEDLRRVPAYDDGAAMAAWIHRVIGAVAMFGPVSFVDEGRGVENAIRDEGMHAGTRARAESFIQHLEAWLVAARASL
jgi:two-component system, NarL family, sensor histidine kinase EvgS